MNQDKWHGCYEGGWQGEIVAEAFAHPAKMSYGLLQRIYDHAFAAGWLKEGDVVVDPFGGIGSTGILGAYRGVQVACVELEAKFSGLAMHNMFLHLPKWRALGSPLPVIIQGDSRRLCELVGGADCVVGSPPFQRCQTNCGQNSGIVFQNPKEERIHAGYEKQFHGTTPGQLGSMKAGSVEAVISSPPYASGDTASAQSIEARSDKSAKWVKENCGSACNKGYGQTPGNLGNLKPGDVEMIVSSPPWENQEPSHAQNDTPSRKRILPHMGGTRFMDSEYGESAGQLGIEQGPTFWAAAKEIVQQCHAILKPGGHAIWVVKDFVRKGQKVDFTGDWRRLCESIGFETVCAHHAMLVKETKTKTLFGDTVISCKSWKSFFRRLCESKGSPAIDWETVLCMQK